MIANFLYRNSKTANIKRRYQSGISDFCGTQSGVRATSRLPRRNGRRGSWRAGRPPDLFGWGKQYRGGIFRLLRDAVRGRGGYSNLREKMIVGGAGGPGALQTSSIGENSTEARSSGFCGTRSGQRRIFELPQGFDARGSWRAGRPPDLFDRRRLFRSGQFRLLRDAVGAEADIRTSERK